MLTEIIRGDTYTFGFVLVNPDNSIYDATGCKLFFTIKADNDDNDVDALAALTSNIGDHALDDAVNGVAYITLDSATCASLPIDTVYYDFQLVKDDVNPPFVKTLVRGSVSVVLDTTVRVVVS